MESFDIIEFLFIDQQLMVGERTPIMDRANMVKACYEAIAGNCPDPLIHITNNVVNSIVPIIVEVLEQKSVKPSIKMIW